MEVKYADIHSHIGFADYGQDLQEVVNRMDESGVLTIAVGSDLESSIEAARVAGEFENVYACIGVHPIDKKDITFGKIDFEKLSQNKKVVAIGECGLDYSQLKDTGDVVAEKARQKVLFEAQVDFAVEHGLPLMVHCRDSEKKLADANREVLEILALKKKIAGDRLRGNIHFFSQTIDIAREYFALGFTVSFTGVITFAREYDEVIRLAPLDRIMSETDAPYVTPAPHRGKRNEPAFVVEVVKKIAEIRGEDFETIRSALVQNALRNFGITL